MSSDFAVKVEGLGKCYQIYDQPRDRLKQFILPRFQRALKLSEKSYFREFWALKDAAFEIRKGDTVGIIGRNGSGKSTLLQMICQTLNPSVGQVVTNGRIAALLELGSGFNPEFTGRENVYLNASILGLSKEEIDERFSKIVDFSEISDFIDQPVKTYSSGMFVRLAFSVVAHVDAEILVIDEALAVGDAFFTQKCMRFLREFREKGTLIFVSHDSAAVKGLCSKAIWLSKGKMVAYDSAKSVSERYLASLYERGQLSVPPSDSPPKQSLDLSKAREKQVESPRNYDFRQDMIDRSTLRNDLKIFKFDPGKSEDFGSRCAEIVAVDFLGASKVALTHIVGGENVILRIKASAKTDIENPIVGFSFKDKLGQVLFGDNTYLSCKDVLDVVESGKFLIAEFLFQMPILPSGEYSVAVAIASGTQEKHSQHHWIHDALIVHSLSSSVSTGLVGVPMRKIDLLIDIN